MFKMPGLPSPKWMDGFETKFAHIYIYIYILLGVATELIIYWRIRSHLQGRRSKNVGKWHVRTISSEGTNEF